MLVAPVTDPRTFQEGSLLVKKREACLQGLLEASQHILTEWRAAMPPDDALWIYGGFFAFERFLAFMQDTVAKHLSMEDLYAFMQKMEANPETIIEECLVFAFKNVHEQNDPPVVSSL